MAEVKTSVKRFLLPNPAKKKADAIGFFFYLAGAERIELSSTVLETAVLPLNHAPSGMAYYRPRAKRLTRDISTCPA